MSGKTKLWISNSDADILIENNNLQGLVLRFSSKMKLIYYGRLIAKKSNI
jgi:hypothetical protein